MQVRKVLYPFSVLYGIVTSVRNKLFDWKVIPSAKYNLPVISVGNITVGGTGKTPFTEYLIQLLQQDYKLALLSRGYKRKTKGALLADDNPRAEDIGDEPCQIKSKFGDIEAVVAEKRVEGMDLILEKTNVDVVIMDDAYQHRYVTPGLSILVIDYNRPLWKDMPFPGGNLRECANGQKRADLILVNKCPLDLSQDDKEWWLKKIGPLPTQKVFFSGITYGSLVDINGQWIDNLSRPVLAIAGIARPEPFFEYLHEVYNIRHRLIFPDHYQYANKDVTMIMQKLETLGKDAFIITTEKDYTRLKGLDKDMDNKLTFLPIRLKVLFEEEKQLELIIHNYVRDYQKDS